MPKDDFIEFSFQFRFRKTFLKKGKNDTDFKGENKQSTPHIHSLIRNRKVGICKKTKGENKQSIPSNLSIKRKKCSCKCHSKEEHVRRNTPSKQLLKTLTLLFGFVILPTFVHNWDIIEPISQLIIWLHLLSK